LHVAHNRVLILSIQRSDLKGDPRLGVRCLHDDFLLAVLCHMRHVHGHHLDAHLVAQPLAQLAPSGRSRLLQIVMNSGAPDGTTEGIESNGDCSQAHAKHPIQAAERLQPLTLLAVRNALRIDTKRVATGRALPTLSVNGVDMHVTDALLGLPETAEGDP
jgi:hypothetical protein